MLRAVLALMLVAAAGTPASGSGGGEAILPTRADRSAYVAAFEHHLEAQVLPYWTSPDRLSRENEPSWADQYGYPVIRLLRLMYVHGVAIEHAQDAAERERIGGQYRALFKQLLADFRDPADGGFFAASTYDGQGVLQPEKLTVFQAYVVYVMADLARRIGDDRAKKVAIDTFAVMDRRGHDPVHGGYIERIDLPREHPDNAIKQLGTNMHVALALARLRAVAPSNVVTRRLRELCDILMAHALVPDSGNAYMAYALDWRGATSGEDPNQQTLYGHNAELVWYLLDALDALGQDPTPYLPWLKRAAEAVIVGGIGPDGRTYTWGPLVGDATDRDNARWWTSTEVLNMLARMYRLTGDFRYFKLFRLVAGHTFSHFVRASNGQWLSDVNLADGTTSDGSGDPWFAGLHVTRMLVECSRALSPGSP